MKGGGINMKKIVIEVDYLGNDQLTIMTNSNNMTFFEEIGVLLCTLFQKIALGEEPDENS